MPTPAPWWLSFVVCLPGLACAQATAKDPEALARQVLVALTAKDQQALESLRIDQSEFKKYIWPTVAGRVASGQVNADTFYTVYSRSSVAALEQHLAQHGGKKLELVKVSTGPEKQYKGYRLLPNPELTVRSEGGQEHVLPLGSALLEHDGNVKVASYYRAPTPGGTTR